MPRAQELPSIRCELSLATPHIGDYRKALHSMSTSRGLSPCVWHFVLVAALLAASVITARQSGAQNANEKSANSTSTNAARAWKEVQKAAQPPMPPAEWQNKRPSEDEIKEFRAKQGLLAGEAADKAKDFFTRFPDDTHAADARKKQFDMLQIAVQLGNTNKAAELEARELDKLKDPSLSEDERVRLRRDALYRSVRAKQDEGSAAMIAAQEKGARDFIKEFPKRDEGYQLLLQVAGSMEESKAREIAKEIAAKAPSDELKSAAEGLLKKFEALGKPLDIHFTAVDGREVDLKKLKGKVVLVDFWATWCGPCVAELPHVKDAYEKLHGKGFEIVGISFDKDKEKLKNFTSTEKMPWPQYFDGKVWENKIGQEYGINSIPAMWLVDKKGNLRDMEARGDLE
jgi:thiol-disulfide isomerase/thioredoxin